MTGEGGDELTRHLAVLSVPNRIELLRLLQVPMTVRQISLPAARASRELDPGRSLSRGAVEAHLKVLQEVGFVHARWRTEEGREVLEYATNHAKLFLVVDELRRVMLQRLVTPLETGHADAPAPPRPVPRGPSLTLVNGPNEGQTFALEGPGPWTVGRDHGADVRVVHDPFVSREHAILGRDASGFTITEADGAKNGTTLNWRSVAHGKATPLTPGDIVGVGRTLLVFRRGES